MPSVPATDAAVRAIIGLGNPGSGYRETRHNAGFWFLEALARRHGVELRHEPRYMARACKTVLDGRDAWLLAPETYMNRSGQAVGALARFFKLPPECFLVAHDDLDLPPGTARLKRGGGHGGHNGLRSLIEHLGKDFMRLRLGIGHPGHKDDVVDYVLSRPSQEERRAIEQAIDRALDVVPELVSGELQRAMNALHAKGE